MKPRNRFFPAVLFALAAIGGVLLLISPAVVQGNSGVRNFGLPDDWTHHHLVFSHPGSFADAVRSGSFENWYRVVAEPRYLIQQMKRGGVSGMADARLRPRSALHNDWTMTLGSGGKVGAGQYPAKYTFLTNTTPSCANDYVVYNTGLAGSSTQASIVAYNNLYATTCSTPLPTIYWAYNTGGTVTTSPVLSLDGTQVAFVQAGSGAASLVVLRWAKSGGTVGAPAAITNVALGSYNGCTAPCYTTLTLNGSPNDTNSPPFYVYEGADTMYIGDNSGKLHKFTGVFLGKPTEVLTAGAPWASVSANVLTGAVYDPVSTNVFVGDSGGFLYRVSSAAVVTASGRLAAAGSTGIVAPPLVDSTPATPLVYAFVGDDGSTSCFGGVCGAVYQLATNFASGSTGTKERMGSGSTTLRVYAGSFDNIHYTGSGTTGHLYACAAHAGGADPRLYQIVMNGTFTGTVNTFSSPTSGAAACSPVTEFLGSKFVTSLNAAMTAATTTATVVSGSGIANTDFIQIDSEIMQVSAGGGTGTLTVTRGVLGTTAAAHSGGAQVTDIQDWIFLSVTATGNKTGCTGACLYNFLATNAGISGTATAGLSVAGGASGIIVDNASTATGASQIYFSSLSNETCVGNGIAGSSGTGGCAVQASQAAP